MAEPGHNNPPSMIDTAGEITASLNNWMMDHPVVETEDMARDAKVLLDRAKLCGKDMEDERDKLVRPINETIRAINERYRSPRNLLLKVTEELSRRVTDWFAKEEAKRIKIAEEARKKAEEAECRAQEAAAAELEAIEDAQFGVESNVGEAIKRAGAADTDLRKALRVATLAEKESKVRIGGGFTRALSLRNKETLVIIDHFTALKTMGFTTPIEEAMIKSAKAFRTIHGELPPGIESQIERSV